MMSWSETDLAALSRKDGVRMRGLEMTRLETFIDAAFAFATTLLVISFGSIPTSYADLVMALKGTPTFAVSFAFIAYFWYCHREWSRRYGLEDGPTILVSLAMVFVMLVYVYPLKMIASALFYWVSNGWFPSNFNTGSGAEFANMFVIYGIGYFAMTTLLSLLYLRALRCDNQLSLNDIEKARTRQEITLFGVMALTGLVSALFAGLAPPRLGIWSGFFYCTLPVSLPLTGRYYDKLTKRLEKQRK